MTLLPIFSKNLKPLAFIISTALLSACTAPNIHTSQQTHAVTSTNTTKPQFTNGVYDTTLDNGLRVLIKEDKRAPIVMTQIWYNVGSGDEPAGKGGISHFLEHLMFKDNALLTGNDYHRLIAHYGGNNNAFTSYDYTAYFESLPANQYPIALQIEAARMQDLIFKEHEILTEKKVVQEERRLRTDDDPLAKAYEEFAPIAMPTSPKARPVIGSMADIEGINLADLSEWYKLWYAPNNATLVLVGDVNPDEAMIWINKYFGDIKAVKLPARNSLRETHHRGYKQISSHQNVQKPVIVMGFNTPSITTNPKHAYALSLLSDIADGGQSARFESNLIRKSNLFDNISINYDFVDKGDGLFSIYATPKAGVDLTVAEQAILDELNRIATTPILDSEITRSQNALLAGQIFVNDSISSQAYLLGMLASLGLPIDMLDKLPQEIAKISKKDIQKSAQLYLSKDNLTTMYILPNPSQ